MLVYDTYRGHFRFLSAIEGVCMLIMDIYSYAYIEFRICF